MRAAFAAIAIFCLAGWTLPRDIDERLRVQLASKEFLATGPVRICHEEMSDGKNNALTVPGGTIFIDKGRDRVTFLVTLETAKLPAKLGCQRVEGALLKASLYPFARASERRKFEFFTHGDERLFDLKTKFSQETHSVFVEIDRDFTPWPGR